MVRKDKEKAPKPLKYGEFGILVAQWSYSWYYYFMKLAISIPDKIFDEAEAFAKGSQTSRSRLYAIALAEYMARHAPDLVTEAMDNAIAAVGEEDPSFQQRAARRVFERSEW